MPNAIRALILLLFLLPSTAQSPAPQPAASCDGFDVQKLAWLAGNWRARSQTLQAQVEETWTAPTSNGLLGVGRTVNKGKTVFFEYLRIEARPDGVFFIAHPKGGRGTEFRLTVCTADHVAFENKQHDFPQLIRYRRNQDGSMTATVEGEDGGKTEKESFEYKRVSQPTR